MLEQGRHLFVLLSFSFVFVCGCFTSQTSQQSGGNSSTSAVNTKPIEKQRGTHLYGFNSESDLDFLKENNIEWVTITPWSHQEDYDGTVLRYHRGDSTRIKRRRQNYVDRINYLHDSGFKVFVKPHVWIHSATPGKWRSDISYNDDEWAIWSPLYKEFIMYYATIAEECNVEMFCIGTELTKLIKERTAFFRDLIDEVKTVYSGELIYAANWYKEYDVVSFWDKLDYIGIQAYFPLVNKDNPSVDEISSGWDKYLDKLAQVSKDNNRKIIFTEIGYKSTTDTARRPWLWAEDDSKTYNLSLQCQSDAYKAFFDKVWNQDWMGGAHIWQYNTRYDAEDMPTNMDFIPLNKPAEEQIRIGFAR